jgi:hypothetical protein
LEGYLWDDRNNDGQIQAAEPFMSNASVSLACTHYGNTNLAWLEYATTDSTGRFSTQQVLMGNGLNECVIQTPAGTGKLFRTVQTNLSGYSQVSTQKVCTTYDAEAFDTISYLRNTVDISGYSWWQQVIIDFSWNESVKQQIDAQLVRKFSGRRIAVAPVPCAQTVRPYVELHMQGGRNQGEFAHVSVGRYGLDYKNVYLNDDVQLFLGSTMYGFAGGAFRPDDDPFIRTEDIGRFWGNVAVHEVGHTMGLVADGFLQGGPLSESGHNDPFGPASIVRAQRGYMMNSSYGGPGSQERSELNVVSSPTLGALRGPGRIEIRWNTLNANYLSIVQ